MFYVYVLVSSRDNHFYVGISGNPDRRLTEHNSGQVKSTKGRLPFKLFYKEELPSMVDARQREKYLKSGIGREFLKVIYSGIAQR